MRTSAEADPLPVALLGIGGASVTLGAAHSPLLSRTDGSVALVVLAYPTLLALLAAAVAGAQGRRRDGQLLALTAGGWAATGGLLLAPAGQRGWPLLGLLFAGGVLLGAARRRRQVRPAVLLAAAVTGVTCGAAMVHDAGLASAGYAGAAGFTAGLVALALAADVHWRNRAQLDAAPPSRGDAGDPGSPERG